MAHGEVAVAAARAGPEVVMLGVQAEVHLGRAQAVEVHVVRLEDDDLLGPHVVEHAAVGVNADGEVVLALPVAQLAASDPPLRRENGDTHAYLGRLMYPPGAYSGGAQMEALPGLSARSKPCSPNLSLWACIMFAGRLGPIGVEEASDAADARPSAAPCSPWWRPTSASYAGTVATSTLWNYGASMMLGASGSPVRLADGSSITSG